MPGVGQGGLEVAAVVVLVADQRSGPVGAAASVGVGGEDVEQDLAFVGLGAGQREADGRPCRVQTRCSRSPQK